MADGGLLPRLNLETARKSFGVDREAASDPSKLESAAEEQQNELEALQSIYGELSDREAKVPGPKSGVLVLAAAEGVGPRVFDVAITAEDNPDAKPGDTPASCMLRVAYSPLYPDSAPLLEIVGPFGGFRANEGMRDRMVSGLSDLSRRNVGMSHIHLLVDEAASRLKDEARLAAGGGGSLYEQLMRKRDEERAAVEAAEKEVADAKKRAAADELERQARASRSVAGLSQARRDDADEEDDEDGLAARARRGWGTQVTKESFAAWRLGFFRQKVQAFVDGGESLAASERMAAKLDGEDGEDGKGEGEGAEGEGGAAAGGAAKSAAQEAREAAVEEFENTSKLPVPPTAEEARELWKRAADKGMVEGGLGTLVVGGLVVPGSRLPPIMGKMQGEPVSASTGKQHFLDQAAKGGAGTMAVGADQAAALAEAAAALRAKDAAAAAAPVVAGDEDQKQAGASSSAASKSSSGAGGAAGGASLLEGVDVGLMEAVAAGLGDEGDLDLDLEDDDDLDDDDDDDGGGGDGSGDSGAGASSGAGARAPAPAPAASTSGGIERSVSGSTGAATPGGNSAAGEADYRAMLVRTAIEGAEAAAIATGAGREVLVSAVERAKTQLEELRKEAEEGTAPASAAPAEAGAGAGQGSAKEADEGAAGGDAASRRERRRARRAKRKEKKAS